jgi:hypothetical protein
MGGDSPVCRFAERSDDDHVTAHPLDPALEGHDAVVVVNIVRIDPLAPQRRMAAAEPAELAREAQKIPHGLIPVEPLPVQEQVRTLGAVMPGLVLEELLTHEQQRDPRSG